MTLVKFLNGDISSYDENEEQKLVDMIADNLKIDRVTVGLVKNEDGGDIDFFVFIDPVKVIYILNMTGKLFQLQKACVF
jgi:hypothetical protein